MIEENEKIPELEEIEVELLLTGVRRVHGMDLGGAGTGLARGRVREAMRREKCRTVSGLQEKLLHDRGAMDRFVRSIREPEPYSAGFLGQFRREIVPRLKTYPFIRIWQAGCGSAFETHALAIILLEEGALEKSTIYSTDADEAPLREVQDGLFAMAERGRYEKTYRESGGRGEFEDYYSAGEESGMFDAVLRRHMVFAQHDFATDSSFNEFNTILCRGSLRGLDGPTRKRAEQMLYESLALFGILGLPRGEKLESEGTGENFEGLDAEHNLYRKIC